MTAYVMPGAEPDIARWIRPCRARRDWMDQSPSRYAYRCIPLTAANTMGWEILNPVNCEFLWNGLTAHEHVYVYREREHRYAARTHFGSGTVTWDIPLLFRTPPDYGLIVTGPANSDKAHVQPLEGFVRSDWLPWTFSMTWRITTPNQAVRFREGEPICRVLPYPLGLLEQTEIELRELDDDPSFKARVMDWKERRQAGYVARERSSELRQQTGETDLEGLWSSAYSRGEGADESAAHEHQTRFKCREVVDRRTRR